MAAQKLRTDYFYKLTLGVEHLTDLLLNISLHNQIDGLPKNGGQLYPLMSLFIQNIPNNARKFFGTDQLELLCPTDGSQTSDSKNWDVTLISAVIQNWPVNVPPLNKYLQSTRTQKQVICDIRNARNQAKHVTLGDLQTKTKFNSLWNVIKTVLVKYKYQYLTDFDALGSGTLLKKEKIDNIIEAALEQLKTHLGNVKIGSIKFERRVNDRVDHVVKELGNLKRSHAELVEELAKRQRMEDKKDCGQKSKEVSFNDLQMAIENCKEIIHKYLVSQFYKPVLSLGAKLRMNKKYIQEIFVDLAIIKDGDVEKKAYISDRDYHTNLLECKKDFVTVENFSSMKDQIILIQGVAGVGKSMLVRKLVSEWYEGRLFNGENNYARVDLLLPILCRTLNTIELGEGVGVDDVLRQIYPDIPDLETLQNDFNVTIVIDGIDELKHIKDIEDINNTSSILDSIRKLLKPDFMPKIKRIVAGRPHVMNLLQSFCRESFMFAPKAIEIIGFSPDNVKQYVYKRFENNTKTADDVLQKIEDSKVTKNLSTIPLYLEIIVIIFKDNPCIKMPSRATELLLYNILIHLRNEKKRTSSLGTFVENNSQELKNYVKRISEFAFDALMKNEIVFELNETSDEKSKILEELEKVGLLLKITKGESGVTAYQFLHLTFQELLASFHFLWHPSSEDLKKPVLRETIVIATGIQGISCGNYGDGILRSFLNKITSTNEGTDSRKDAFNDVITMVKNDWTSSESFCLEGDELIIAAAFENQPQTGFFKMGDDKLQTIEQKKVLTMSNKINKHDGKPFNKTTKVLLDGVKSKLYNLIQVVMADVKTLKFKNVKILLPWDLKYFKQDSLCEYMSRAVDLTLTFHNYDSMSSEISQKGKKPAKKTSNTSVTMKTLEKIFNQFTGTKFSMSSLETLAIEIQHKRAKDSHSTIFPFLLNSTHIRKLQISKCSMTDETFSLLLDSLSRGKVEEIDVSENNLTQLSVFNLFNHLNSLRSLVDINFRYNKFKEIDKSNTNYALQVSVPIKDTLKKINLAHCSLTDEMFSVLLDKLVHVRSVGLQYNKLTQLSLFRLFKHLAPSSSLKDINFVDNQFENKYSEEINPSDIKDDVKIDRLGLGDTRSHPGDTRDWSQILPIIVNKTEKIELFGLNKEQRDKLQELKTEGSPFNFRLNALES